MTDTQTHSPDATTQAATTQATTDRTARRYGCLTGNLTEDPDLTYTHQGTSLGKLRIAVHRRTWDPENNRWTEVAAQFYTIKAWGRLADHAVNILAKGDRVVVYGYWNLEQWTNRDGEDREQWTMVAEDIGASMLWAELRIQRNKPAKHQPEHAKGKTGDKSDPAPHTGNPY